MASLGAQECTWPACLGRALRGVRQPSPRRQRGGEVGANWAGSHENTSGRRARFRRVRQGCRREAATTLADRHLAARFNFGGGFASATPGRRLRAERHPRGGDCTFDHRPRPAAPNLSSTPCRGEGPRPSHRGVRARAWQAEPEQFGGELPCVPGVCLVVEPSAMSGAPPLRDGLRPPGDGGVHCRLRQRRRQKLQSCSSSR